MCPNIRNILTIGLYTFNLNRLRQSWSWWCLSARWGFVSPLFNPLYSSNIGGGFFSSNGFKLAMHNKIRMCCVLVPFVFLSCPSVMDECNHTAAVQPPLTSLKTLYRLLTKGHGPNLSPSGQTCCCTTYAAERFSKLCIVELWKLGQVVIFIVFNPPYCHCYS